LQQNVNTIIHEFLTVKASIRYIERVKPFWNISRSGAKHEEKAGARFISSLFRVRKNTDSSPFHHNKELT
jgi:hypothetical protein